MVELVRDWGNIVVGLGHTRWKEPIHLDIDSILENEDPHGQSYGSGAKRPLAIIGRVSLAPSRYITIEVWYGSSEWANGKN